MARAQETAARNARVKRARDVRRLLSGKSTQRQRQNDDSDDDQYDPQQIAV